MFKNQENLLELILTINKKNRIIKLTRQF